MPRLTQSFSSTAIASASYDTDEQRLEITFTSGKSYTYENVPESIWDGLVMARSAGSYFAEQIKGRY
jgi:hypothetical protein